MNSREIRKKIAETQAELNKLVKEHITALYEEGRTPVQILNPTGYLMAYVPKDRREEFITRGLHDSQVVYLDDRNYPCPSLYACD